MEGVVILPETSRKKVLVGTRMSVDKLKRDEHESGQQMEAAFQRDGLKIEMDTNTKAGFRV